MPSFLGKPKVVEDIRCLCAGDQIAVAGQKGGVMEYYHHGIYEGEGTVIDFSGVDDKTKSKAAINRINIDAFTDGGDGKTSRKLVRIEYEEGKCLPAEEVVENAKRLYRNKSEWGQYNLVSNNCEHFATCCKTGVAQSEQVENAFKKVGLAAAMGAGVTLKKK